MYKFIEELPTFLILLNAFVTLEKHIGKKGAYDKAADELEIDSSSLRRRIEVLSELCDADLLEGRGSQLRLTYAGSRVYDQSVRLLTSVKEFNEKIFKKNYIVCCSVVTADVFFNSQFDVFENQGISFNICTDETSIEEVMQGKIDMAIVNTKEPPSGVNTLHLTEDRLLLAASPLHWLTINSDQITPDSISRYTVFIANYNIESYYRARISNALTCIITRPSFVYTKGSYEDMVAMGFGLEILFSYPGFDLESRLRRPRNSMERVSDEIRAYESATSKMSGRRFVELQNAIESLRKEKTDPREHYVYHDITHFFELSNFWLIWQKRKKLNKRGKKVIRYLETQIEETTKTTEKKE